MGKNFFSDLSLSAFSSSPFFPLSHTFYRLRRLAPEVIAVVVVGFSSYPPVGFDGCIVQVDAVQ